MGNDGGDDVEGGCSCLNSMFDMVAKGENVD